MQFGDSSNDSPWPRDMLITVDQPPTLLLLLFVRSAWGLDLCGVPPLDAEPQPGATTRPDGIDLAETNARWTEDWARAIEAVVPPDWGVREPDAATKLLLDADLDAHELMHAVSTESYWRVGLDADAEWAWRRDASRSESAHSVSPEHDVVEWLVPVWRSGLRTIVELPFAGFYVDRIDREHVIVSRTTRRDPELYSLALSTL